MNRRCGMCALLIALLFLWSSRAMGTSATPPINLLLAWTDNSGDGLGFMIERAESPNGPWIIAGASPRNRPEFLDGNLRGATTYYYRVQRFSERGVSEHSNVAKITTPSRALPPRVRRQPVPGTVSLGGDAILGAEIGGNPPFRFQWQRNGTNMPGATTQVLSLKTIMPQDAGVYSLVVGNDIGVVASKPVKLTVLAPVVCSSSGGGRIVSLSNGQELELGRTYKIGAVAGKGNVFQGWRINGTNGPLSRTMNFTMQAGLELNASFRDVTAPTVTPRNLKSGAKISAPLFALTGTAVDNTAVTRVQYQINNGPWLRAAGSTNWQAQLWLKAGPNVVRVFASDAAGNNSRTNTLAITSLATNNTVEILPPMLTDIRWSNGVATVSLQGVAGAIYQLEYNNLLADEEWIQLESSLVLGSSGEITLVDDNAPVGQRFYRVLASSAP